MKNKILITGSEGVIGNIIRPGLENNYETYCLDVKDKERLNYFKANISKVEELGDVFSKIPQINTIIHLASYTGLSWKVILNTNIIGIRNIYEVARKYKVNRLIYTSSNHVTSGYESNLPQNRLINTSDPIKSNNYYGSSKAFGEIIARQFYELYKIKSICLRIGHVCQNNKPKDLRSKKIWLSHSDLRQIINKSINTNINFGIYYAISDNDNAFLDISNAMEDLRYEPKDNLCL